MQQDRPFLQIKPFVALYAPFDESILQTNNTVKSNLALSNFAFSSSWLQRQLAVRLPISIGMVRHVPLAPSAGQGTE